MDRPLCKCHGEPMARNGSKTGSQQWRCASKVREKSRADYWERGQRERKLAITRQRRIAGLCQRCGKPRLTASACWECLNEMEARYALRV